MENIFNKMQTKFFTKTYPKFQVENLVHKSFSRKFFKKHLIEKKF
jgi:hypothetical protein